MNATYVKMTEIEEILGEEKAARVVWAFSRNRIWIPVRALDIKYEKIYEEYRAGAGIAELARKYRYSRQWIYEILSRQRKRKLFK